MGIFDALERRADVTWTPTDSRWYTSITSNAETFAGFGIDPDRALRVSAVFACTSLIAETLASLPCTLYRRTGDDGREKAKDHRLYRTLHRQVMTRRNMTPMDFFGSQQMHLGLRGGAFSETMDDGKTIEMVPMHPDLVDVEKLADGRIRYKYRDPLNHSEPRLIEEERVLHVRDLPLNGTEGIARAALAREAIAVAAAGEAFVGGFFKHDATGRLLIKHPSNLPKERREEFREMIHENHSGWQNRSKAMLLTHGVDAVELGKHDDGGFIVDPRNFQVADIARSWRVPLFMIGLEEKSTTWGTGVEAQKQGFVDFTIKPWTDRWAQSMQLALLDDDEQDEFFIEFNFKDLVRGDLLTRMKSYQLGHDMGMFSPNELRRKENEGPREGGDEYQETPSGTAPNAFRDDPEPQAGHVPAPLLADAARRIANAEGSEISTRAGKPSDTEKWAAWLTDHTEAMQAYSARVLEPFGEAYTIDHWAIGHATYRIRDTARTALAQGLPDGWLARREAEIVDIIEETFTAARALAA